MTTARAPPTVGDNQKSARSESVARSPEKYHFIEKITHFDRERHPERVVHARGAGANGIRASAPTVGGGRWRSTPRAKPLPAEGVSDRDLVRFSSVNPRRPTSPETRVNPVVSPPSYTPRTATGTTWGNN